MSTKLYGKALVIQLTRDHIRIAKMQLGTKAQMLYCTKLTTPDGAVDDGSIKDMPALTDAIKTALAAPDFKGTRRVIFALCTTRAISEKVNVPAAAGQRPDKTIDVNLDMYFPVTVSDYRITRKKLGCSRDENNNRSIIMQLWAIPKAMLTQYYALAAACGLNVLAIDYCGHSHVCVSGATFMETKPTKSGKIPTEGDVSDTSASMPLHTQLYLLAEPEMMVMTFVRDGHVQMQRSFLCSHDIDSTLGETMMVIDYYRSLNDEREMPIEITICGSLSEDPLFRDRVEGALLIPAHIQESDHGPGWCNCIGAAQTELDFGSSDLSSKRFKKSTLSSVWHYAVMLGGAAAAVYITALLIVSKTAWDIELLGLRETKMMLSIQAEQSKNTAEAYDSYKTLYQNLSNDRAMLFDSLRTYNDNLVLILHEIESIMPVDSFVESIDIQAEGMSLQFSCPDKSEVAYLITALRGMKYAALSTVSNLSGTTGKVGFGDVEPPPDEGSSMMDIMQEAIDNGQLTQEEALDIYLSLSDEQRTQLVDGKLSLAELPEILAALDKEQQDKLMDTDIAGSVDPTPESSITPSEPEEPLPDSTPQPTDNTVQNEQADDSISTDPDYYIDQQTKDNRIHFSVYLTYSEELINAELERKGFNIAELPAMLEVEQ